MNLSNTQYIDILVKYSDDMIKHMVFQKEPIESEEKSDIGIVLRGISMIPYRLEESIKLYKKGRIEKILLTGGIGRLNLDRITPEAIKMKQYLLDHGIPVNDIIMESKAKNSYENIKYSLDVIEEKYSKENTKITLITSDFYMKRCMLLMAKFLDCSHYTGRIVKDGKTDLTHWQNTLYGKRVIFQEALLLSYYAKHQRIQDESIEILRRKHTI